ncbi:MAG: hypothetical protein JOZ24_03295, partial [Candidatus Eremiobacteraeota bacterium]|nr:hypothetical protein [Candidatus Eremiobacteraeota bacterium]
MTTAPQPLENVFARAWALLQRNWIIIVPGIVIGIAVGVIHALLQPSFAVVQGEDPSATLLRASHSVGTVFIMTCVGLLAFIATQAYTTGMAGAAWQRGTATLADGSAAFQHDAGRILMVAIGLIVLAIVAAILAIPTLGTALIAYYLFCLYSFPAAIVGNAPGWSGITESFRIAAARFVPTLIVGVMIFVISL